MEEKISIHDNFLLSYTVNCRESMITMQTAFYDREPHEFTDVAFTGVIAYHLECDNLTTIIFDIVETPLHSIYAEYEALFSGLKNHGWPLLFAEDKGHLDYKTPDEMMNILEAQNIKGFRFRSSYGMEGFVLAQEMTFRAAS